MDQAAVIEEHVAGVLSGQRASLGRAITLVESARPEHQPLAQAVLQSLLPHTGRARRIGISGVPGVGKSSFIERLGLLLIEQGHKLAVLAIDPSSTLSGGSILGDKTRMARLANEERAFIRPSPSGGTLGGVAQRTREAMLLVEAAGFDVVLIETVGVGQSELEVAKLVDSFLLLLLPGGGDELQGIKRGVVEICDVLAVNKADGDALASARRAQAEYSAALHILRSSDDWSPPVLLCSALEGTGLKEVWAALEAHRAHSQSSGAFAEKRSAQQVHWMKRLLDEQLRARFDQHPRVKAELARIERDVAHGEMTPAAGAAQALALIG